MLGIRSSKKKLPRSMIDYIVQLNNFLQNRRSNLPFPPYVHFGACPPCLALRRSCKHVSGARGGPLHLSNLVLELHSLLEQPMLTPVVLPSGLISTNTDALIGTGVVFNVEAFFKELAELESKGVPRVHERIHVSSRCHLNFALHAAVDGLSEEELGTSRIGTVSMFRSGFSCSRLKPESQGGAEGSSHSSDLLRSSDS